MLDVIESKIDYINANVENQTKAMIVIPAYNESKRINAPEFLNYLKANPQVSFLFVNDGSKDNTIDILWDLHARNRSQVQVLDLAKNGGKAEAVRQGLIEASKSGVEYVGYWDADLATPLNAINDFLNVAERLPEIEVILGARKAMLGHKINRKFSRRVVSRSCAILARFAAKLPVSDTQTGAKILKNTMSLQNAIAKPFTAGWLFDVELFARLSKSMPSHGGKFYEFPLMEWNEIPGSKVDANAIISSGFIMLRLIAANRLGMAKLAAA